MMPRPVQWRPIMLIVLLLLTVAVQHTQAREIPASHSEASWLQGCTPAGTIVTRPIVDGALFCPEYLVEELPPSAVASITAMTYAPACDQLPEPSDWCGRLFFARPDAGMVQWVGDFDPVSNAYTLHTFVEGLNSPNGLIWHEGTLYVADQQSVYALRDDDNNNRADDLTLLVEDLPASYPGWANTIRIGLDDRLYVSLSIHCEVCDLAAQTGELWRVNLDGSEPELAASGLYDPFDFVWHPGSLDLWVGDTQPDAMLPDELNRAELANEPLDFGWPDCPTAAPNTVEGADCSAVLPGALTLPVDSVPGGMAIYQGEAFPHLQDDLLVVARGGEASLVPQGYALYRFCLDAQGQPEACQQADGTASSENDGKPIQQELVLPVDTQWQGSLMDMNIQGQSFYPEHPVDVAISPEGYIAISVMEGRIIRLLPR
jgi:glucose/arabinose dehydrogenase